MQEPTDRQAEIISAAFTLIENRGGQDLTIKNLGLAIGVSEPAIYRHFASKRNILESIVDKIVLIKKEAWRKSREDQSSPLAKLKSFFLLQASQFQSFPALTIILFPEDVFRNDQELNVRIQNVMKDTIKDIEDLLVAARKAKEVRKEVEPRTASLLVTGGFRILVSNWRMDRQNQKSDDLVRRVERFLDDTVRILE